MANWFYIKDGVPIGPISDEVFQQLTSAGQIRPTDLIRHEASNNWVQAQQIHGINFQQGVPQTPQGQPIHGQSIVQPVGGYLQTVQGSNSFGQPLTAAPMVINRAKSKPLAGVLAIFLGGFGVQDFYLGVWGWGILSLLFCWSFIPLIWGIIDGLVLLTMSDEKFDRKYNFRVPGAFETVLSN